MNRRRFLIGAGGLSLAAGLRVSGRKADPEGGAQPRPSREAEPRGSRSGPDSLTLFLAGDVMLGRGIDQVLSHSVDPRLHEPYVRSAERYVDLAERRSGPIPAPVPDDYVWGDALEILDRERPAARIVNLETAVTASDRAWEGKGIHYRMHPGNASVLTAAGIDCCVLANNHVLDWGRPGLDETLRALGSAGIAVAGAGRSAEEAASPAALDPGPDRRILVFGLGSATSGIRPGWRAGPGRAGVNLLDDLSADAVRRVADAVDEARRPGDVVVASIHWGANWGYGIPEEQRDFARGLVEYAGVDVIHGHSSHHPKGIEVHRGRPILYGCGDFLNDYEGISGHEEFRGELTLMYLPTLDADGSLLRMRLWPLRIRRFRLQRASVEEASWLGRTLSRVGEELGTEAVEGAGGSLELRWRS